MINKCFVTKITSPMENNSEEYFYGVKIQFDSYTDGAITIYINRLVDDASEIINKTDGNVNYVYDPSGGPCLYFTGVHNGYIIIKDLRNLYFTNVVMSAGNYPIRRTELNTAMYANVLAENAALYSKRIVMNGKVANGNIIDFSKFIKLTTLELGHRTDNTRFSYIEGSLEELAEGMISFGRTSGALDIVCNGFVTVNGIAPANCTVKTITFDDNTYTIA